MLATISNLKMSKTLDCKLCGALVHNVGSKAGAVVCWQCVAEQTEPPPAYVKKSIGYPRGWRFKAVFVHQDGTVYHRGVEQSDLKGTLPPTPIETKEKKSKVEKQREREEVLAAIGKLKKQLKLETRKGQSKKLQTQIKKLQKKL